MSRQSPDSVVFWPRDAWNKILPQPCNFESSQPEAEMPFLTQLPVSTIQIYVMEDEVSYTSEVVIKILFV